MRYRGSDIVCILLYVRFIMWGTIQLYSICSYICQVLYRCGIVYVVLYINYSINDILSLVYMYYCIWGIDFVFFVREGLYVLVCALLYIKCLEYRIAYMVLLIWNCFYAEFLLCVIVDKVLHMGYCVIRIEYIVLWMCYFYFVIFMLSIKNIWYRVWVFHVYIYICISMVCICNIAYTYA
jgi:hypothetical protein